MVFRLLDDITVAVHYLVMGYIVFGGFLAWRWRWTIVTHGLFICWAVITLVFPWANCPLTLAENLLPPAGRVAAAQRRVHRHVHHRNPLPDQRRAPGAHHRRDAGAGVVDRVRPAAQPRPPVQAPHQDGRLRYRITVTG